MITSLRKTEHSLVIQPYKNIAGSLILNFRAIRSEDGTKDEYKFWISGDLGASGYLDISDEDLEEIEKFIQAYKAFK